MAWTDEFSPVGAVLAHPVAVVVTDGSIWLIDAATYTRLPRAEWPETGRGHLSNWGRLDDATRHRMREAVWVRDRVSGALRIRILPVAGPADGYGILTGQVMSAKGLAPADPGRRVLRGGRSS